MAALKSDFYRLAAWDYDGDREAYWEGTQAELDQVYQSYNHDNSRYAAWSLSFVSWEMKLD